jgi:hypothetical protein
LTVETPPRVPRSVPSWHELAACKLFPELDFVEAKAACAVGALERREKWGVWGGLSYRDRKAVAAEYGYEPPGDPPEHGTNARRVKWGCVCFDCRRAHAVYEADRRANARRAALRRSVWTSPLLVLARPVTVGRVRLPVGQYLLPLDLPAPKHTAPDLPALPVAA